MIDAALRADVPHSEKLVLVFLARHANTAGIGAWRRDLMESQLGYKRRSVQRILKALRDGGYLIDVSEHWYQLQFDGSPLEHAGHDELPDEPPAAGISPQEWLDDQIRTMQQLGLIGGDPLDVRSHGAVGDSAAPVIDGREIGDQIAQHVIDAADYLVDQLNTFEQRFAGHIDRFALIHVEHGTPDAPPPPPPDPVRESERYQEMIAAGIDEETAYSVVEKLLQIETVQPGATSPPAAPAAPERTIDPGPAPTYQDSPLGRCERIADILAGGARPKEGPVISSFEFAAWQELEASENKHSVKGEVPAFEQLYPAIVTAARANVGMSLSSFIDVDAAAEGNAPWDRDPSPSRMESATLEAEIESMLAELRAANDPRCMVQPRIVETAEDGSKRTETIDGYHRRVSAVYKQMQRLKAMGVM